MNYRNREPFVFPVPIELLLRYIDLKLQIRGQDMNEATLKKVQDMKDTASRKARVVVILSSVFLDSLAMPG